MVQSPGSLIVLKIFFRAEQHKHMKTSFLSGKVIDKKWLLVDAKETNLGRLASKVAHILLGKHKSTYAPFANDGDRVVIINAEQINLTGDKWNQKKYYKHTGYHGGIKEIPYKDLREKKPAFIVEKAIRGMLPKNRLGRHIFSKNLKVYANDKHEHQAQNPLKIKIS